MQRLSWLLTPSSLSSSRLSSIILVATSVVFSSEEKSLKFIQTKIFLLLKFSPHCVFICVALSMPPPHTHPTFSLPHCIPLPISQSPSIYPSFPLALSLSIHSLSFSPIFSVPSFLTACKLPSLSPAYTHAWRR